MQSEQEQEQEFQDWLGREQSATDTLTKPPLERLAATLDRKLTTFEEGDALPPLWHWLFFLQATRHSEIAEDGHPQRGDFLPPIPLPRRMWAGSRLQFERPMRVGETLTRRSTMDSIKLKEGRSGQLGFVTVAHTLYSADTIVLREHQDIVYRDMPTKETSPRPASKPELPIHFARSITPDPAMLFRYSALSFNAHRIHYDRQYAENTENYPGLVVHGPLLATLLLELFQDNYPNTFVRQFEFKALRPVFDTGSFQCCGSKLDADEVCRLWVEDAQGSLCLEAKVIAEFSA